MASAIVDTGGPVYVRLKRGEIPVIFPEDHELRLEKAEILLRGTDLALLANGMMLASALEAARLLEARGISVSVTNVPVIKPLDAGTVTQVAAAARAVVVAENHSVIGGLGTAVAETLAEAGLGRPLRRVGLRDTFAEGARTAPYLFARYGLSTQAIIDAAWAVLDRPGPVPVAGVTPADEGEYSPV